ncbi:hypothetical protein [Saccharopolyspora erythraea]|uniref:Uncharacterized protein n=1 Tax=Saccharopolyspora erythraea TaxID=1836 RepID=A0ABN1EA90_SACER|nr:hypothetical protein [Saccharopolyspora erythraea]QRK88019.1 hypothetical protein JQX30_25215 [Saccharopolyspora erythraea]
MAMTVKTKWNGERVTGRARVGAVEGLRLAAEHVLGVSLQLVPLGKSPGTCPGITAGLCSAKLSAGAASTRSYGLGHIGVLSWVVEVPASEFMTQVRPAPEEVGGA